MSEAQSESLGEGKDKPLTTRTAHLIDDNGNIGCPLSVLTNLVTEASVANNKNSYSIVAIMGCQSTGKSTLLNLLFKCNFKVMDASTGRSQTTRGIWLDSSPKDNNLVIMDLEGTDALERGEDRTTFERQTALYALSLCSVLMINMWEHDIGRYTASNYGILKTVFEVNLSLFEPASKTILLFIIRDHIEEETPFDRLKEKITKEINLIWSELRKPEKFKELPIDDLFIFEFCVLPHAKLAKADFQKGVDALRAQFIDSSNEKYFFSPSFISTKSVPSDGFGPYADQIWRTIKSNKELDLPSQKEMLASFRSDEIIAEIFDHFIKLFAPLKEQSEHGVVSDFGSKGTSFLNENLDKFSALTVSYHKGIVAGKKIDLTNKLGNELFNAFKSQMGFVNQKALSIFTESLLDSLSKSEPATDEFFSIVNHEKEQAIKYSNEAKLNLIIPSLNWDLNEIDGELNNKIESVIQTQRQDQLNKLAAIIEGIFKSSIQKGLSLSLTSGDSDMWNEVHELYEKGYAKAESILLNKLTIYKASESEISSFKNSLKGQLIKFIRKQVDYNVDNLLLLMRQLFDKKFKYDEKGILRQWGARSDPRSIFFQARDQALKMTDLYKFFPDITKLNSSKESKESDTDSANDKEILLSSEDFTSIRNQFLRDVEGALLSAENEKDRNSQATKIPPWFFVLFFLVGYNELQTILTNPIYLLLTVIIVVGLVALHQLNLLDPAINLVQNAIQQLLVKYAAGKQNSPIRQDSSVKYKMEDSPEVDRPPSFSRASSTEGLTQRKTKPQLDRASTLQ